MHILGLTQPASRLYYSHESKARTCMQNVAIKTQSTAPLDSVLSFGYDVQCIVVRPFAETPRR